MELRWAAPEASRRRRFYAGSLHHRPSRRSAADSRCGRRGTVMMASVSSRVEAQLFQGPEKGRRRAPSCDAILRLHQLGRPWRRPRRLTTIFGFTEHQASPNADISLPDDASQRTRRRHSAPRRRMERGSGSRRGDRRRAIAIEAERASAALEATSTKLDRSYSRIAVPYHFGLNVNLGAFDRICIAPLS